MIAAYTYQCIGAEEVDGTDTVVPAAVAVGKEITHLFINRIGVTIQPDLVNGASSKIRPGGLLSKGDVVQILYKVLPRWTPPEPPQPELLDFNPLEDFSPLEDFIDS